MERYDVIVVGAGPSGGNCAIELAKLGHKVLIVDKETEIGEPVYSTAGTPIETLKFFDLPKKIIQREGNSLYLAGQTKEIELVYAKTICCSLNLKELKQFLVKEAIKNGAETIIGATVTHPITENNKVIGIKYHSMEGNREIKANIIVDASGPTGVLASQLGLRKQKMPRFGSGVEFLMENLDLERNSKRFDIYLSSKYIPAGYAWIFPTGKNEAKVGIGWIPEVSKEKKYSLIYYLHRFIKSNKQTTNGQAIEIHSGFVYPNSGISKHTLNGFIAIGDAACQVNPLAGEGIRHCLYSGKFAADIINKAIKDKDYTETKLKNYDSVWKNYIGHKWEVCVLFQKIAANLTDKEWDLFLTNFDKLKNKEKILYDFLFNYSFKELIKQLPIFLKTKLLQIFKR